jgi:hypothetical protein
MISEKWIQYPELQLVDISQIELILLQVVQDLCLTSIGLLFPIFLSSAWEIFVE